MGSGIWDLVYGTSYIGFGISDPVGGILYKGSGMWDLVYIYACMYMLGKLRVKIGFC